MMFDLFHHACFAAGIDHDDPVDESPQQGPQKAVEVKGGTQGVKFTPGLQSPEASVSLDETMPVDEPGTLMLVDITRHVASLPCDSSCL